MYLCDSTAVIPKKRYLRDEKLRRKRRKPVSAPDDSRFAPKLEICENEPENRTINAQRRFVPEAKVHVKRVRFYAIAAGLLNYL